MVFALLRLRLRLFAILAIALVIATPALPVRAQPACRGSDIIDEMKVTAPALHTRIKAAAAATQNGEAVLWRIEKSGLSPSHLLGTVHLSDPRVATLTPAIRSALDASKRVVLEVADLSAQALGAAMGRAGPLLVYSDGSRLDGRLTADDFQLVKTHLAKSGLPDAMASLVRPWFAYMLLSVSQCERQRVTKGAVVLDMQIANEGRRRQLPVSGLETLEQQLAAMAAVSDAQQVEMLKATLKFVHRSDDLMETMLRMYIARRLGEAWPLTLAMAEQAGVAPAAFSGFESELVIKRNHKMRDNSLPLLAKGGAFIGVGALHLVGAEGLVALYRQAGYTVTAIE